MPEVTPYPKSVQTRGTPGSNRWCPKTGALHADCDCIVSRNKRNRDGGLEAQRRDGKQLAKGLGKRRDKRGVFRAQWRQEANRQCQDEDHHYGMVVHVRLPTREKS